MPASQRAFKMGSPDGYDGRTTWLVHNHLNAHEPDFDAVDRDSSLRAILGVDKNFAYEVLAKEDWIGRRLVASRLRKGRAFIAGDSAHLWVPYAGYNMNAGIADACNLAWLLAARIQGWAGEHMLDAYEAERLPITEQVSRLAMDHAQKVMSARAAIPSDIEDASPQGEQARAAVGQRSYALNVEQFCCAGLNFGCYYTNSPIILADDEAPPTYTMGSFTPSTVPGCRTPHVWLKDGRSLFDAFGPGYTLLYTRADARPDALVKAARTAGMPLTVLDLSSVVLPASYRHRFVLCRSDQHVAWRSDTIPELPDELRAQLCGKATAGQQRGRTSKCPAHRTGYGGNSMQMANDYKASSVPR